MRFSRLLPVVLVSVIALGPAAGSASATTIEDLVKLKAAKVSDDVLIALIESDGSVFYLTADDILPLKQKGFSDKVIIAMLTTATKQRKVQEQARLEAAAAEQAATYPGYPVDVVTSAPGAPYRTMRVAQEPQQAPVVNVTQHVEQVVEHPQQTPYYPYYSPYYAAPAFVPVAQPQPVYWGFGGQRRPDTWQTQPPQHPQPDPSNRVMGPTSGAPTPVSPGSVFTRKY